MPPSRKKNYNADFVMKYIAENGGHAAIETMPIETKVQGWRKLHKLQKRLRAQKMKYSVAWTFPKWYHQYIAEYEPDVKLPSPPNEELASLPAPDEDSASDSEPPSKIKRVEGSSAVPDTSSAVPAGPPKTPMEILFSHIAQNGGHAAIETVPVDGSLACGQKLIKLQRNLKNHRGNPSSVFLYPDWYKRYLSECEPDVELPEPGTRNDVPAGLARYILEHGGHSAIETMPLDNTVEKWTMLADLQQSLRDQRIAGSRVQYPKWYMKFISSHQPDVKFSDTSSPMYNRQQLDALMEKGREIISYDLIRYILNSGGHSAIETMRILGGVKDRQMLQKLQQNIRNQRKLGITKLQYPKWYKQYVALKEPHVQLPDPLAEEELQPDKLLIEPERRNFTHDQITSYIFEHGGNAKIETMPIDTSVEGWEKLHDLQKRLRDPKLKGTVWLYPKWYKKYIATHEPGVVLVGPNGPSRLNPKCGGSSISSKRQAKISDPGGGPGDPDISSSSLNA